MTHDTMPAGTDGLREAVAALISEQRMGGYATALPWRPNDARAGGQSPQWTDARRREADQILSIVSSYVEAAILRCARNGLELRLDGSSDTYAAAYFEGVRTAHSAALDVIRQDA